MGAEMLVQLLQPDPILLDDPVRPKISPKRRIEGRNRYVYAWVEDKQIYAVVCVSQLGSMPKTERELFVKGWLPTSNFVVLYSVWSYKPKCGSKLVNALVKEIRKQGWFRIVTMSPQTEMARQFHLKNGAKLLQTNKTTVNYEY
jgi:hypothetical protein